MIIHENDPVAIGREIERSRHVIVDIGAPWCGPCNTLSEFLEELDGKHGDKVVVLKLDDTSVLPELLPILEKYEHDGKKYARKAIKGGAIPILLFYRDGKIVNKKIDPGEKLRGCLIGCYRKGELDRIIADHISM